MKGGSWIAIVATFLLEIIAFGLGLGALAQHNKGYWVDELLKTNSTTDVSSTVRSGHCGNMHSVAALGAGAVLLLILGHAVVTLVTGCFCCGSGETRGRARACAIFAFIMAWICFLLAGACLIAGVSVRETRLASIGKIAGKIIQKDGNFYFSYHCQAIRENILAAGVAFTALTLILDLTYYLAHSKARHNWTWEQSFKNGDPAVNMAAYPGAYPATYPVTYPEPKIPV
ncbi:unnamed protein product [Calypogeia fissa]